MVRQLRDPSSRTRIVEAAWRVVAEHGLQGATMRIIAAEAGVTTGYVTHYFEDKQELLLAVLRHNNTLARTRVFTKATSVRGLAGAGAAIQELLPLDDDRQYIWRVWVAFWTGSATAEFRHGMIEGRQGLQTLFARLFAQAVEDGDLPGGLDLGYEAERLVTLVAGLGLHTGVDSEGHIQEIAQRMIADHLNGLCLVRAALQDLGPA